MLSLSIRSNRIGPIRGRHPWVFSGALEKIPDGVASGEPVALVDDRGRFLASGYFNSYSQISVRLWSWDEKEKVDGGFFKRRVEQALALRASLTDSNTNAYRLINAENDMLPGLIVDRYADHLVLQCHTRGIERWKSEIVKALIDVIKPMSIYERSDVSVRRMEKLDPAVGPLFGDTPEMIEVRENGLRFLVDVKSGQKTGFFLDQRDKRAALQRFAAGRKVLNTFCYTGGFSVYALAAGAAKAVSVDSSSTALALAQKNVALNDLDIDKAEFVEADAKEYLAKIRPGEFDLIVLDPPAFIKDRRKQAEGIHGYKKINEAAMRAIAPGGILITCSCSNHLSLEEFRFAVSEAAGRAGRTARILEIYTHGLDHPVLASFNEGEYLKVFVLEVE